jgi:hypothetical protein
LKPPSSGQGDHPHLGHDRARRRAQPLQPRSLDPRPALLAHPAAGAARRR